MRRFFVIFLILLFPLNVLALSLSVAAARPHLVQSDVSSLASDASAFAGLVDVDTTADIDPDEPPAMDLHDIVNHETVLQLAALPGRLARCHDARRHCHSLPPPVKPPRVN